MAKDKKMKEGIRRLSVREKSRNAQDVASWVGTTQPSRKNKEENRPERRYSSQKSILSNETDELIEVPNKLDGGSAWLVVVFSHLLHFIADGLTFSFGMIFHAIVEKFKISRFIASIIGSCFLAFPLALSPFSNAIAQHLGNKQQLLIGLGISSIGIFIALSGLVLEIVTLFSIGFSLFLPLGLSFIYNGAIVIVTLYFDRRLGLATSLSVSGTGIGTMLFPQIIQLFENAYPGESATYTCIFACFLTTSAFFFGFFFIKDVEWNSDEIEFKKRMFEKRVRKLDRERRYEEEYEIDDEYSMPRRCTSLPALSALKDIRGSIIDLGISMQSIRESVSMTKQVEPPVPRSRSVGHFMRKNLAVIPEYTMLNPGDFGHLDHLDLHLGHSPANTIHSKPASRNRMLSKTSMSVDAINAIGEDEISHNRTCFSDSEDDIDDSEIESDSEVSNDGESSESELSDKVLTKKETKVNGHAVSFAVNGDVQPLIKPELRVARPSLNAQMPAPGRVLLTRNRFNTNLLAQQGKMPSAPHICPPKKKWHEKHELVHNTWAVLKVAAAEFPTYFRILRKDFVCRLFLTSVSLLYLVLDVAYMFFYDHAVENLNISSELASVLTTSLGCSSLISTWLFGYLADMKYFKSRLFILNGISMIMVGFALTGAGFATGFWSMWVCSVILGIFISSNYVLQNVLVTKLYPNSDEFMPCYAMICMFEGIFTAIGPPVVGFVRDTVGEYTYTFFFAGGILGLSGIFSIATQIGLDKNPRGESPINRSSSSNKHSNGDNIPMI